MGGTTWTIRVESQNNQGCYILWVNYQAAPPACVPAAFCIAAGCATLAELGVPAGRRAFYAEGFERTGQVPGLKATRWQGTAQWQASTNWAQIGRYALHLTDPASPTRVTTLRASSIS